MNSDKLSDLPEWDDEDFRDKEEEGEEWKPNPTRDACKALYLQWQQVMMMLKGLLGSIDVAEEKEGEDGFQLEYWKDYKGMIVGDAYQVAAKIKSSEAGGMYVLRMENAAIIRKNAQFVQSSILTMMVEEVVDKEHGTVLREEIDKFKELFRQWVATFVKDEFEDEWGLFI